MNHIQSSTLIAAAIGATVGVISAASIFIYHKIIEQSHYTMTTSNIEAVNQKVSELQAELEALRLQQSQQRKKKRVVNRRYVSNDNTITDNDTDIDAYSTAGTDIGDDEFYDCSDSEGAAGDNEISEIGAGGDNEMRTSEAMNNLDLVLAAIDDENDEEKERTREEVAANIYKRLQNLAANHPNNVEVAWRYARACYNYFNCMSDEDKKKRVLHEGMQVCENVIDVRHVDLHKWYAILLGLYGEFLPIADKIKNGNRFKDHINLALEMRPQDSGLHHLLGRFKFEVAGLSWIQRKIAAAVFSEPPSASYQDAIDSFELAEKYATSPHMENRLFLSKSYIAVHRYDKVIEWLNKTIELPVLLNTDRQVFQEANELLTKYSKKI